jgi:outer membrane protein assembly factor BamB
VTPRSASRLALAWHWTPTPPTRQGQPGPALYSSPVVSGGRVFIGADTGDFYALAAATGKVAWSRFLGFSPELTCPARGFVSTAAIDPDPRTGRPTVYATAPDGYLYALDASDGTERWRSLVSTTVSDGKNSALNWSSPTVEGGRIYVGVSSDCDNPLIAGSVESFDQASGKLLAVHRTMPEGEVGGGVWTTVATDGRHVFATTGNAPPDADRPGEAFSIVGLDPATLVRREMWAVPPGALVGDSDFGASPTLFAARLSGRTKTEMVGACNKNGRFYALRANRLRAGPVWTSRVTGRPSRTKCLAAAVWDGRRLFVAGGGTSVRGRWRFGSIRRLDPATGARVWVTPLPAGVLGTPSVDAGGVIAVPTFDYRHGPNRVFLVSAATGRPLGHLPIEPDQDFAQPAFAQGFLFVATVDHGLYAFRVTL